MSKEMSPEEVSRVMDEIAVSLHLTNGCVVTDVPDVAEGQALLDKELGWRHDLSSELAAFDRLKEHLKSRGICL